jgi:Zn-dependent protease with chaperone function
VHVQNRTHGENASRSDKTASGHSVFSTHPSVEARLERLAHIAEELSH